MISDKEIVFEVVLNDFKEVKPEFESSFNEYEDCKQTVRNDYVCRGECFGFYQYFLAFGNNYPNDFKKAYQCDFVKFKLKKKYNEPSLSNFKSYLEMFHNKNWVEEKGDEVVIGNITVPNENKLAYKFVVNNDIDKRYKEEKSNDKRNWDFDRFPYGRDYKYGWEKMVQLKNYL